MTFYGIWKVVIKMKKISIIILIFIMAMIFLSCTATPEQIEFYLNPGIDTVEINSNYEDPGVTARAFKIKRSTSIIENTLDITKLGTYHITYNFVYQNFDLTLVRIITVIDETPPVLALNTGVDTIKIGEEWVDSSVKISDNSNQDVTLEINGTVNINRPGIYTITYIATDLSGNQTSIKRYVNVVN